jgi:hypothetical protein
MSDTRDATDAYAGGRRSEVTGWAGWVLFAGAMMVLVGAFQATMGLVALFNDKYFLVTRGGLLLTFDYTTWGWIHLLFGLLAAVTGVGLIGGQTWARGVGIGLAVVSALVNLAFLPAFPWWCTLVIALNVITIYAIAVHGREVETS